MALAFPVADTAGNFICPIDQKVYCSLKSLRSHLSTTHREEYMSARERMCNQVVPGTVPTEEQLVAWRKNPVGKNVAAGLLGFDTSMFAGIRITPKGELDLIASIARFRGVSDNTAILNLRTIIEESDPNPLISCPTSTELTGTGAELASKIKQFQFGEGRPTPVAAMHVAIQLLMLVPGPEAVALRAVSGEVYIRANVNDLDLRQAMEQKGASISREVEDVVMGDLPRSEEAKQESRERVREGDDDNWLHASPGPDAEARAALFCGFSALDVLARAKLMCLIYKGITRAEFSDAMCAEIDATRIRDTLVLTETTKATLAQEATKQAEERTKQVTKKAEEATKAAHEATKQAEETTKVAEEATKQKEEATKTAREATRQAEETTKVIVAQESTKVTLAQEATKQSEEATKAKEAEEATKATLAQETTKQVAKQAEETTKQVAKQAEETTKQTQETARATIAQAAAKQARANALLKQVEFKTLKWKRKHSASSPDTAAGPETPTSKHPCFAAEDQDDLVHKLQHLAEVARSPATMLTNADCANLTTNFRTVEELDNFLDELDLRTREKVWPHEKRQLDVVESTMAKVNGKLVTQLVRDGRATLHVCSYRGRRSGCFYFGLGFNG
jgi:hypothetical protein